MSNVKMTGGVEGGLVSSGRGVGVNQTNVIGNELSNHINRILPHLKIENDITATFLFVKKQSCSHYSPLKCIRGGSGIIDRTQQSHQLSRKRESGIHFATTVLECRYLQLG